MEINIKELVDSPESVACFAGLVCDKFSDELFQNWKSQHMEEFEKELGERVKILVANSIEEHRENVGRMVRETLKGMTKEEVVKAMLDYQRATLAEVDEIVNKLTDF